MQATKQGSNGLPAFYQHKGSHEEVADEHFAHKEGEVGKQQRLKLLQHTQWTSTEHG